MLALSKIWGKDKKKKIDKNNAIKKQIISGRERKIKMKKEEQRLKVYRIWTFFKICDVKIYFFL